MPRVAVGTCASTGRAIELFYETFGDPVHGVPLLLIMGLGAQMIEWPLPVCERFAAHGHYVIRFDHRDVGLSTVLEGVRTPRILWEFLRTRWFGRTGRCVYTLDDMARDCVGLLDALHVPAAHLVGLSMGGMLAQILALDHPHRVLSLSCIMSSTGEPDLPPPHWGLVWTLARPTPSVRNRRRYLAHRLEVVTRMANYDPRLPSLRRSERKRKRTTVAAAYDRAPPATIPASARHTAAILAAPGRHGALVGAVVDHHHRLGRIPRRVIHGTRDPMLPLEHAIDLAVALAGDGAQHLHLSVPPPLPSKASSVEDGCHLLLLEGMGHDLLPGVWDAVVDAISHGGRPPPTT